MKQGGPFSAAFAKGFFRAVEWAARHLHVQVTGMENLPAGRALIVGNHAFGWDISLPRSELWMEPGPCAVTS